jgi:cytidine deaminase
MADEADRAAEEIDALLAEQIRSASRAAPRIKPCGYCRYCMESVAADALFCCAGCREDYEVEQAQLKRLGRRHR